MHCSKINIFRDREVYKVLDQMKIDLANFAIKSVRPHIQHQQFEYERSTFAKLVQRSPGVLGEHDFALNMGCVHFSE